MTMTDSKSASASSSDEHLVTTANYSSDPEKFEHGYPPKQTSQVLVDSEPSDPEASDKPASRSNNNNNNNNIQEGSLISGDDRKWGRFSFLYRHGNRLIFMAIYALFTAWWIFGLCKHRERGWVVLFLIWLSFTVRLIFFYLPSSRVLHAAQFVWLNTVPHMIKPIPVRLRTWAAGAATAVIIIIVALEPHNLPGEERIDRVISLIGLGLCIFALWATSRHRSQVVWHTVIVGMLAQFIIALFVLRTGVGFSIFNFLAQLARELLGYAKTSGMAFLTSDSFVAGAGGYFYLVGVLPCIALFVAIVNLLIYWGTIQWVVGKAAAAFFWIMKVSGAEALVAAASPFLGQGESAALIKQLVPYLTRAEFHQVMCSGFATVSGSGLAGYIALGVNAQPLICSCAMSIPASLAISKLRYPETEQTLTAHGFVAPENPADEKPVNFLHAASQGAWQGIKIAAIIGANLLVVISLIGVINGLLGWWGRYWGIHHLTLELILGYIFYPVAFFLGVPRNDDLFKVSRLIGTKVIVNEYVAYSSFQTDPYYLAMSARSRLIVTFALCGFGNIGSLGIQIGVLSQLCNDSRVKDISRVAMSALVAGVISTLTSASIAGLLLTEETAAKFM
ncbi:CNT family concentrative nucleoside transporter [Capronia coronata CBS 617.96]|uniref:CNT family concentrative nucleoside transporter n=1 Tax=Capronia coronata CBS 617.96 TaxID=1182541 RepID=W9YZC7_9EURO|nr:CNT family concentrative nucleoside transporter [Capronia coronata CBS 617.96]EXJ87649.1 CNT family concentrative nucleoside transporter [Capronia coronata CBS 617.96]